MNSVADYNNRQTSQRRYTCMFYLKGRCKFGNRCRNIHEPSRIRDSVEKDDASSSSGAMPNLSAKYGPSSETIDPVRKDQSKGKMCGICFDIVVEKTKRREQMFGILPNCNHCFCFGCIRKWRQSKEFDFSVAKACPECRVGSGYVYPSRVWFEVQEEKDLFVSQEKSRMQKINCRYFNKGNGRCPFGNTCLYLHALPDGTKKDVGPPKPRRRRVSNFDADFVHELLFWLDDYNFDWEDEDDDVDFEVDSDDIDLYYNNGYFNPLMDTYILSQSDDEYPI